MECADCGRSMSTPYYTGDNDEGFFALCASCAGWYLCPDEPADAMPEHRAFCVGSCGRSP